MNEIKLILASESPRRSELLHKAGFEFLVHPSKISESLGENLTVEHQIVALARHKAQAVKVTLRDEISANADSTFVVLGADTLVVFEGKPLGKPTDRDEAIRMLMSLSGQTHLVMTGVCLLGPSEVTHLETTRVRFRELTLAEVESYVDTGEPMDKAGAYGIQGAGGKFVAAVDGSWTNVMGLPMEFVARSLVVDFGIASGRDRNPVLQTIPLGVSVVAVSKLQPVEKILRLAADTGQIEFGENYVQEAIQKIDTTSKPGFLWHMIGHLQTNKVKDVVGRFALIHSVDSLRLAEKISSVSVAQGLQQRVLIEVNLAGEESKSGVSLEEWLRIRAQVFALPGLRVVGFMTMPPLTNDGEANRPFFRRLRELRDHERVQYPFCFELSMGTSADYRVAIEEGATMVRLGSILFGERKPLPGR